MEGKEKGKKEAVETNVVHSGLFDTKKPRIHVHIKQNFPHVVVLVRTGVS